MQISGSQITMSTAHTLRKQHTERETLHLRRGTAPAMGPTVVTLSFDRGLDTVRVSAEARRLAAAAKSQSSNKADPAREATCRLSCEEARLQVVVLTIEKLTGRKVKTISLRELADRVAARDSASPQDATAAGRPIAQSGSSPGAASFAYERTQTLREQERLEFRAAGRVTTADGVEIEFQIEISMEREVLLQQSVLFLGERQTQDPLVVNFAGQSVALTPDAAAVDIDQDGTADQLHKLAYGSGYLVLDSDGDGRITSGEELFGPVSGDGFAELASHDADNNGWIDAGDAIYARLRLWHFDDRGDGHLSTLAECGVGAIYLQSLVTPFELHAAGDPGQAAGQLRSTGVFVGLDKRVGTVQQFDVLI